MPQMIFTGVSASAGSRATVSSISGEVAWDRENGMSRTKPQMARRPARVR